MARDRVPPAVEAISPSSMASLIKAYALPLILLSLSVFYQLFVLPRSFPPSHYDVLGIRRYSSIDEVKDAYAELSSNWNSSAEEVPSTMDFIKIRYAYELLVNPLWKRDYDIFGIDEEIHVLDEAKVQYGGKNVSEIGLPLLDASSSDPEDNADFSALTSENFGSMLNNAKALLIQVYSRGSGRCARFFNLWKEIAALLDGIANTGLVELSEVGLVITLGERKPTGKFFFRNGLPSLVAFPPGCGTSDCLMRFEGHLSVDAVTDWLATTVLGLPRILYYSKESLVPNFLAKTGPHKVKVIFFSKTGERATPFVRQTARDYWAYASFAMILWREEDFSFWWNAFEVESAPAIVFVKDPGLKPVVVHGSFNNSRFSDFMEKNKQQELPQLRSVTSLELGCDARGYSRAGNDTLSWYCVILAGRLGPELNKMRETMRRVEELLSNDEESSAADKDQASVLTAALKNKRLTFTWLDGEAQQKYCLFYLHSETSYETCGTRRDLTDVPRLFIVRYKRNATQDNVKVEKRVKKIWNVFDDENVDPASQLVARYNGSNEIPQIIKWISETVSDGDSKDLPFYRTKTPELVPEDSNPIWSKGAQNILSKSVGLRQRIRSIISSFHDYLGDPRIGPMLLMGALMSSGAIWLMRNQRTNPSRSSSKDESKPKQRRRARQSSSKDQPPSVTDEEPKGAFQMPLSDSDSE